MKIYTKKGDDGTTSIIGDQSIDKHNIRIEAYGTIDELNSYLGLLCSCPYIAFKKHRAELILIQNILFEIGTSLASTEDDIRINSNDIKNIENFIDKIEANLEPLKSFILPGGDIWSSYAHISRSICRRAERRVTKFNITNKIDDNIIKFINRLSDYLFVLARYINHIQNVDEIKWNN